MLPNLNLLIHLRHDYISLDPLIRIKVRKSEIILNFEIAIQLSINPGKDIQHKCLLQAIIQIGPGDNFWIFPKIKS